MSTVAVPCAPSRPLEDNLQRSALDKDPDALLAAFVALPPMHPSRPALRGQVIEAWLPLAHHLAGRYADRSEPAEDLRQVAAVGLIKAVDRFDPAVCEAFVAFAVPTITGEIKRYFRDHSWHVHVRRAVKDRMAEVRQVADLLEQRLHRAPSTAELAEHLEISEAEVAEVMGAARAYRSTQLDKPAEQGDDLSLRGVLRFEEPGYDLVEQRPALAAALAGLDARSREIVWLRYFRDLSQQQIAERVGVSQMQVSRVLTRILTELRTALAVCG